MYAVSQSQYRENSLFILQKSLHFFLIIIRSDYILPRLILNPKVVSKTANGSPDRRFLFLLLFMALDGVAFSCILSR
jgi:hypothetical protein